MRQTKTALNKFYKFLRSQKLITGALYQQQLETLKPQFSAAEARQMLREENQRLLAALEASSPVFSAEIDELIEHYFDAFANLYGVISCDQAYRIIRRQNPQLELSVDDFIQLIERFQYQNQHLYSLVSSPQMTIINHELLTAPDSLSSLHELTEGRPFAIPKRTILLKYVDEDYVEDSPQLKNLKIFYQDVLGIPESKLLGNINDTIRKFRTWTSDKISPLFSEINEMLLKQDYGYKDRAELEQLVQNLIALYNITPKWSLRGHSPSQVRTYPNALELLDNHQSTLNKRLVKMIKSATIDPMEIILYLLTDSDFDQSTIRRFEQQLINLDIPSLD